MVPGARFDRPFDWQHPFFGLATATAFSSASQTSWFPPFITKLNPLIDKSERL
jgi:hypothetical protein